MHPRRQIREAIVAALNAIPELSGRVDTNRARPTTLAELPKAIVYTLSEESEEFELPGLLRRSLSVGIELRTSATDDLDDALDALCEVAEAVLSDDMTFGGLAERSWLSSTVIGLDGEGESRQALATLAYIFVYATKSTSSEEV